MLVRGAKGEDPDQNASIEAESGQILYLSRPFNRLLLIDKPRN